MARDEDYLYDVAQMLNSDPDAQLMGAEASMHRGEFAVRFPDEGAEFSVWPNGTRYKMVDRRPHRPAATQWSFLSPADLYPTLKRYVLQTAPVGRRGDAILQGVRSAVPPETRAWIDENRENLALLDLFDDFAGALHRGLLRKDGQDPQNGADILKLYQKLVGRGGQHDDYVTPGGVIDQLVRKPAGSRHLEKLLHGMKGVAGKIDRMAPVQQPLSMGLPADAANDRGMMTTPKQTSYPALRDVYDFYTRTNDRVGYTKFALGVLLDYVRRGVYEGDPGFEIAIPNLVMNHAAPIVKAERDHEAAVANEAAAKATAAILGVRPLKIAAATYGKPDMGALALATKERVWFTVPFPDDAWLATEADTQNGGWRILRSGALMADRVAVFRAKPSAVAASATDRVWRVPTDHQSAATSPQVLRLAALHENLERAAVVRGDALHIAAQATDIEDPERESLARASINTADILPEQWRGSFGRWSPYLAIGTDGHHLIVSGCLREEVQGTPDVLRRPLSVPTAILETPKGWKGLFPSAKKGDTAAWDGRARPTPAAYNSGTGGFGAKVWDTLYLAGDDVGASAEAAWSFDMSFPSITDLLDSFEVVTAALITPEDLLLRVWRELNGAFGPAHGDIPFNNKTKKPGIPAARVRLDKSGVAVAPPRDKRFRNVWSSDLPIPVPLVFQAPFIVNLLTALLASRASTANLTIVVRKTADKSERKSHRNYGLVLEAAGGARPMIGLVLPIDPDT